MHAISANNLTKRYGRKHAVDGISFDIEQGEIVGFLGPNGAGKTTTLRMLAGLIKPSKGSSTILGKKVPSASLLDVGTMIEEPSFYPYMSGRDNLRHAAKMHGGVSDRHIDEMLNFVSMDQAATKRVRAYSQGMRQRLGLARALLWQPKVLLLDEPTNGLDPVGIAEIRENLRTIAKEGVTILISSHILAELEKLVERILAVERGKLLYDGPLQQMLKRIDEKTVTYFLEATNADSLRQALSDMAIELTSLDGGGVQVTISQNDAPAILANLIHNGVELIEARRITDNLEGAYLRLLREDGRPV
ncbi:MAG: ATP-binding cassette domain-containing protein [Trueperaceae bacterium]|nr:ATP-binding cassette domain-containing protein [Trueperaceae bacterium]